jgi:outer membrane protein OmpA-like peptidoglycan-associated protein
MSRCPRAALWLAVGAILAATAAAAEAQTPGTTTTGGSSASVLDITYPVLDLAFETASLDRSVRRVEDRGDVRVTLAADVLFAFNSARLGARARSRIAAAAADIRGAHAKSVKVVGYTDNKGSPAFNLRLSRRRADAVQLALAKTVKGSAPKLSASGKGETNPVASNTAPGGADSPKGRARNRRVEILIPRP